MSAHRRKKLLTGFTLIESLVAITVVLIGIVAPLTLASRSIAVSSTSKNRLIAANVAQEGVELVRNIRDSNFLSRPRPWDDNIPPSSGGPAWMIDRTMASLQTHDGNVLYLHARSCGSGCTYYEYLENVTGSTRPSIFTRQITIVNPAPPPHDEGNPIQVTVTVTWSALGQAKSLVLRSYLYNWP